MVSVIGLPPGQGWSLSVADIRQRPKALSTSP